MTREEIDKAFELVKRYRALHDREDLDGDCDCALCVEADDLLVDDE